MNSILSYCPSPYPRMMREYDHGVNFSHYVFLSPDTRNP